MNRDWNETPVERAHRLIQSAEKSIQRLEGRLRNEREYLIDQRMELDKALKAELERAEHATDAEGKAK